MNPICFPEPVNQKRILTEMAIICCKLLQNHWFRVYLISKNELGLWYWLHSHTFTHIHLHTLTLPHYSRSIDRHQYRHHRHQSNPFPSAFHHHHQHLSKNIIVRLPELADCDCWISRQTTTLVFSDRYETLQLRCPLLLPKFSLHCKAYDYQGSQNGVNEPML